MISIGGCTYYIGKVKTFDVTASTKEGKRFVEKYHVRYLTKIYGALGTDFYKKEGKYAINIKKTEDNRIQYTPIKKESMLANMVCNQNCRGGTNTVF